MMRKQSVDTTPGKSMSFITLIVHICRLSPFSLFGRRRQGIFRKLIEDLRRSTTLAVLLGDLYRPVFALNFARLQAVAQQQQSMQTTDILRGMTPVASEQPMTVQAAPTTGPLEPAPLQAATTHSAVREWIAANTAFERENIPPQVSGQKRAASSTQQQEPAQRIKIEVVDLTG